MRWKVNLAWCALIAALGGCRQEMYDQPKLEPMEAYSFFADRRSLRPQVRGTVARAELEEDRHLYTGFEERPPERFELFPTTEEALERTLAQMTGPQPAATFPFVVTWERLARGRERFDIFCAPCHGLAGYGDGMVVRRGFRRPPSYHIERLRRAPPGHLFDVISRGIGAMGDFADRIPPPDRWAIAGYIRALQLSQWAQLDQVPPGVPSGPTLPPDVPPVRLMRDPEAERAKVEAGQRARLASYGWIDPERRILHIPIERAMELVVERGLPVRAAAPR